MSPASLSRIEQGKQDFSIGTLLRLCDILECSPNDVLSTEAREPATVLAALDDLTRAKRGLAAAIDHVQAMEVRLRTFAKARKKRS